MKKQQDKINDEEPSQLKRGNIPLKVRCGDCIFFSKFEKFGEPCEKLGVLKRDKPCKYFSVDPFQIDFDTTQGIVKLKNLLNRTENDDLKKFAAIINQHIDTRNMGLEFGEVVWVKLFQDDYLSNYFKAKVVQANKGIVYVHGIDGHTFTGTFQRPSVFTLREFREKRKELRSKKKITDPNFERYFVVKKSDTDKSKKEKSVPEEVEQDKKQKKKSKKKSKRKELTETFTVR